MFLVYPIVSFSLRFPVAQTFANSYKHEFPVNPFYINSRYNHNKKIVDLILIATDKAFPYKPELAFSFSRYLVSFLRYFSFYVMQIVSLSMNSILTRGGGGKHGLLLTFIVPVFMRFSSCNTVFVRFSSSVIV